MQIFIYLLYKIAPAYSAAVICVLHTVIDVAFSSAVNYLYVCLIILAVLSCHGLFRHRIMFTHHKQGWYALKDPVGR